MSPEETQECLEKKSTKELQERLDTLMLCVGLYTTIAAKNPCAVRLRRRSAEPGFAS